MYAPIVGWMPDADDTSIGVLPDVHNMIPTLKGYAGAPSPYPTGLTLAAECRGAVTVSTLSDVGLLFAGTQTKIYLAGTSSWTDVSRAMDYTGSSSSKWRFTQQGDVTIAVNKTDASQYYLYGTSTDFADVAGMPKAALVEAVGNFILIGNYNDGTDTPDGWGCSAIGDYTDWTPDIDTQCTYGRLYDTPGNLTGLKRLADYAIFYKDESMYLARYVGTPSVWEFALVSDHIGAVSQESIARVEQTHFFCGKDNFYAYDSSALQPIGEPIREWFNHQCNNANRSKIISVHDNTAGVVYWYYPSGTSEALTDFVAYNYRSKRWGKGELSIEASVQYVYGGKSYDEVETTYTTFDGISGVAYDDIAPAGDTPVPAIIDTNHAMQTLSGQSVMSSMTSNDFGQDGEITLLTRVRPRYMKSPTSAQMTNLYKDDEGIDPIHDKTVVQVSGKLDVLRAARWHRVRIEFSGDVEIAGADISVQPDGLE